MPIFMFGAIFIQKFLDGRVDVAEKKILVLDGTGQLFEPLESLARVRNETELFDSNKGRNTRPPIVLEKGPADAVTDEMRLALSERVRRNEVFAFVEIEPDALKPNLSSPLAQMLATGRMSPPSDSASSQTSNVRVTMESIAYDEIGRWIVRAVNQAAFAERLKQAGLDPNVVLGAIAPIDVKNQGLYMRSATGEIAPAQGDTRTVAFLLPLGIVILMFMSLMVVTQPMLTSVLEEKQQRIAEVLLGSASPFQIMMGKLIGNVGVALTIVAIYMVGGYAAAAYYGYAEMMPTRLIGWFIAFEILAGLMFGALFIAVGAACSDLKESQGLLMPVMLVLVMPLMVWFTVMREPLSSFSQWISLFPPATPMLMMLRMAASPMIPLWQPVLGMALVLVATLLCIFAAGRVFRIGLLMQGKAPKLGELIGWVVRG